jgi:hypothetical protein
MLYFIAPGILETKVTLFHPVLSPAGVVLFIKDKTNRNGIKQIIFSNRWQTV